MSSSASTDEVSTVTADDLIDLLQKINDRLETIEEKVNKIDSIDKKLSNLTTTVASLESQVKVVRTKADELEVSIQGISNLYDGIKEKCDDNSLRITSIDSEIDKLKTISKEEVPLADMKEAILDLQCRSMKNNLVFHGIPEMVSENTEETLRKFFKDQLKIDKFIEIGNTHRFGKKGNYDGKQKHRPIVARYIYHKDLRMVLSAGPQLKGTSYGINQQYPPEIEERRRKLYPKLKEAKDNGKRATIIRDKLIIDGKLYVPPKETERPAATNPSNEKDGTRRNKRQRINSSVSSQGSD